MAAAEGSYRPAARPIVFSIKWNGEPAAVTARGGTGAAAPLERLTPAELEERPSGWSVNEDGFVVVKMPTGSTAWRL